MDKILEILASSLNTEEYCISVKEPLAFRQRVLLHPTLIKLFELFTEETVIACEYRDIRWGPGGCGLTIEWVIVNKQKILTFKQWKNVTFQEKGLDAHVSTIPSIPAKDLQDFFLHILISHKALEEVYWRKQGRDEIDVKVRADEDEKEVISDAVEGKSKEKYNKEKDNKEKHDKRDKKEAKDNGGEEKEYELSNSNGKDEGSS
ncbi:hypothetical protein GG344DRAFT_70557 [Lentinula edodes]|nr:hypothetical protein GG344DRAFT_70557 [Lentinula edodes]